MGCLDLITLEKSICVVYSIKLQEKMEVGCWTNFESFKNLFSLLKAE